MRKLKFDKLKYGRECLIDTVDLTKFEPKPQPILINHYMIACAKKVSGITKINHHTQVLQDSSFIFVQPGTIMELHTTRYEEGTWVIFEGEFLDFFFNNKFFTYKFDFFHGIDKHYVLPLYKDKFDEPYILAREIHSEHLLRSSLYLLFIRLNRYYGQLYKTSGTLISDKLLHNFDNVFKMTILLRLKLHPLQ